MRIAELRKGLETRPSTRGNSAFRNFVTVATRERYIRNPPSAFRNFLLKGEADGDLRTVQRQLIKEVAVAKIIIEVPVTNLGKDVARDLAA
jgi:hypothetical protein